MCSKRSWWVDVLGWPAAALPGCHFGGYVRGTVWSGLSPDEPTEAQTERHVGEMVLPALS